MSLLPKVLGRTQQEGHELGGIFSAVPHKTFLTKTILTAVPPAELQGREKGKSDLGKLQSSSRARDFGRKKLQGSGRTGRDVRNAPHSVRGSCRALRSKSLLLYSLSATRDVGAAAGAEEREIR